jgi:hypothetical protein
VSCHSHVSWLRDLAEKAISTVQESLDAGSIEDSLANCASSPVSKSQLAPYIMNGIIKGLWQIMYHVSV